MADDLYSILEVSKDANDQDIKKAYRKLSLQYHPDRNPTADAEKKIRKINEAYEILSDPQKRQEYDNPANMSGFPPGFMPHGFHQGNMNGMDDINNIFNMFFNGGMPPGIRIFHNGVPQNMFQKPQPIPINLSITMEQAYHGCAIPISLTRWKMLGNMKVQEEETFYLNIPAGIDENEHLVLQNKGNIINEQCKGDVQIAIQIQNNTVFKRQGLNLIYQKEITLKESLCGFLLEIIHLNGKLLSLNNKTNHTIIYPNYKKIVPGLGMSRDGNVGNLVIEFSVTFPDSLTNEQIAALEQLL